VREHVNKTLFTSNEYTCYFAVHNLQRYPDDYQIGDCRARKFDALPKKVQDAFVKSIEEALRVSGTSPADIASAVKRKRESLYLSTEVATNAFFKASESARERIQISLDILRMIHFTDFQPEEYCIHAKGSDEYYSGGTIPYFLMETAISVYQRGSDTWVKEMNALLTKKPTTEIERKLTNAHHILAVSTSVRYPEVRFILMCSALEALVLTDSDKDYLGWKLAERVAFLTANPAKREEKYKKVKALYGKRSSFVHQSGAKKDITDEDVDELRDLVISVFLKMMNFRDSGFKFVREQSPPDPATSVVDHIDRAKFSTSSRL
jgi:hypothetical protein